MRLAGAASKQKQTDRLLPDGHGPCAQQRTVGDWTLRVDTR
jgi:hypothetical protein